MKTKLTLIVFTFFTLILGLFTTPSNAQSSAYSCSLTVSSNDPLIAPVVGKDNTFYFNSAVGPDAKKKMVFHFDTSAVPWGSISTNYTSDNLAFWMEHAPGLINKRSDGITTASNMSWVEQTGIDNFTTKDGTFRVQLVGKDNDEVLCEGTYSFVPFTSCKVTSVTSDSPKNDIDATWTVNVSNIQVNSNVYDSSKVYITTPNGNAKYCGGGKYCSDDIPFSNHTLSAEIGKFSPGQQYVKIHTTDTLFPFDQPIPICEASFFVFERDDAVCNTTQCFYPGTPSVFFCSIEKCSSCSYCRLHPSPTPTNSPECNSATCQSPHGQGEVEYYCNNPICGSCNFCSQILPSVMPSIAPLPSLAPLCDQIPSQFSVTCKECQNQGKLWTAIGCVPTDITAFLKDYVFRYGFGIAGGIAFLYFLYGAFLVITSAGVAEKVAEGREIIVSALSGLLLIILSVVLLRIIGVDILKIPGFS